MLTGFLLTLKGLILSYIFLTKIFFMLLLVNSFVHQVKMFCLGVKILTLYLLLRILFKTDNSNKLKFVLIKTKFLMSKTSLFKKYAFFYRVPPYQGTLTQVKSLRLASQDFSYHSSLSTS